jgi:predicted metal-binding membrane protein
LPRGVLLAALLAAVAIGTMVTTQDLAHSPVGPVDVGLAMLFLVGWILMSTAMMLPTALPLVALLERTGGSPCALMGTLAFLLVWFSLGPVIWLASSTVAGFWGPETTEAARLRGTALIIAGVYQLSPLVRRCLDACRHPFGFLARHWGATGKHLLDAATIGAAYGLSCVGCCAALMVVMMLVGCTDLAWMLTLGLVMAFQKHAPFGRHLVLPVGITLIAAGLAITGGLLDWSAGIERSSGLAIDSSLCIAGTSP